MDQCYKDIVEKQFSEARFVVKLVDETWDRALYLMIDQDTVAHEVYFEIRADENCNMQLWVEGKQVRQRDDWAWLSQDINDLMVNMQ